jgi:hypothetical protein
VRAVSLVIGYSSNFGSILRIAISSVEYGFDSKLPDYHVDLFTALWLYAREYVHEAHVP